MKSQLNTLRIDLDFYKNQVNKRASTDEKV